MDFFIIIIALALVIGLIYLNYSIAKKNNRSTGGVIACSIIISPLIVLIYLLIVGKKE
jgi:hypothetical protein